MKMYSVKEAAELMGISERRVRKLLAEGRIKGRKHGRDWIVTSLAYTRKRKYMDKGVAPIENK